MCKKNYKLKIIEALCCYYQQECKCAIESVMDKAYMTSNSLYCIVFQPDIINTGNCRYQ